ncbi:hypothetical protein AVEN_135760-1 [Araneus ventricosus]|uniref:Uncharacterized protein n=1 Tax=Araneus ventricosus TaxID=182803 RepID=A0A4Y2CA69_ARAVE|nr:hypothetical protein AVEN_135760-1 [Araneus ventricosus]
MNLEQWASIQKDCKTNISFEDFLDVDNELQTCGTMTDKEIVENINAEISDENEELDQQEREKVTVKEAGKVVELLRCFLNSIKNIGTESFGAIATLEKLRSCKKILRNGKLQLMTFSSETTKFIFCKELDAIKSKKSDFAEEIPMRNGTSRLHLQQSSHHASVFQLCSLPSSNRGILPRSNVGCKLPEKKGLLSSYACPDIGDREESFIVALLHQVRTHNFRTFAYQKRLYGILESTSFHSLP